MIDLLEILEKILSAFDEKDNYTHTHTPTALSLVSS